MTAQYPAEPARSWFDLHRASRSRLDALVAGSLFGSALASYFLHGEPGWMANAGDERPATTDLSPTATAIRGFLLAIGRDRYADLAADFRAGVHVCAAQEVPRRGPSVHWNPQLLIGIAAGLGPSDGADEERRWLSRRLNAIRAGDGAMDRLLAAHGLVCLSGETLAIDALRAHGTEDAADAAVALWLGERFGRDVPTEAAAEVERLLRVWEHRLLTGDPTGFDLPSVAAAVKVSSVALRAIASPRVAGVARMVEMIRRFPTAVSREPQPPADEYQLQRVLWTMLAGTFTDLQDEAWLAKFGVYHPRADFAIESLKVVVEAKFTRAAADFRSVQDEITADASSYTSRPAIIDRIVAVVYDRSSSQYQYETFRHGLRRVPGVTDVIVFPAVSTRPSKRGLRPARSPGKGSSASAERKPQAKH
ncbi:MAG: hypothetical protein ABIQ65_07750 [Thermoanaerobaculia bacterium]